MCAECVNEIIADQDDEVPAGAKGAVVFMDPSPHRQLRLPPFGRVVVELKLFADTFGIYEDNITFNV